MCPRLLKRKRDGARAEVVAVYRTRGAAGAAGEAEAAPRPGEVTGVS
ncbi:hypothetical protein [Streptomyces sp. 1222.5]